MFVIDLIGWSCIVGIELLFAFVDGKGSIKSKV